MLLNLGGPLVSSHAVLYPLQTHTSSRTPPALACSGRLHLIAHDQHNNCSGIGGVGSIGTSRRRTRPHTASGPRLLHPRGSDLEGVPSSLFTFRPKGAPKTQQDGAPMGNDNTAGAATTTVGGDGDLYAGLMEESDLPDISALLVEARNIGSSFVQTAVFMICGNPSPMWAILARGTLESSRFVQSASLPCACATAVESRRVPVLILKNGPRRVVREH